MTNFAAEYKIRQTTPARMPEGTHADGLQHRQTQTLPFRLPFRSRADKATLTQLSQVTGVQELQELQEFRQYFQPQ